MAALPGYTSTPERIWYYGFRTICAAIFFFLIFPLVVIVPLSFNAVPFFTFTKEMLALDPAGYSVKWYEDFFTNLNWQGAVQNSLIIAFFATILAAFFGTLAALGLSRPHMPARTLIMSLLISPMIVPLIISAAGMFFFYSRMPENICHGIVRCLKLPTKSTTTTSSNEVMKANRAPEITPGRMSGTITLKKVRGGDEPRLAEARIRLLSKPTRVAVTVMTTNGVPSAAWARITPRWVPCSPIRE
jgi:ABC-type sugar transport system permease subunit